MNAEMNIRPLTDADRVGYEVPGKWKALVQQVIRDGPLVVENAPENLRTNFRVAARAQGMKARVQTLKNGTGSSYIVSVEPMKDTP